MQDLLQVNNLTIEFRNKRTISRVVDTISFGVASGEIVGIVGESGSGKTMTALAISGLLNRHSADKSGEILFEGKNLLTCSREELRKIQGKEIGMIFQEPMSSLNPVKRIGKQVEESLKLHTNLSKQERKVKALEALAQVELPNPEKVYRQYPHELSGGMRQRVMIASAFICNPKLLIADEPTTALDVTIQAQIIKLLKRLSQEHHTSVIFISHDLSLVQKLCTKAIVMYKGEIAETGCVEEIFEAPREAYTRRLIRAIPAWPY